MTLRRSWCLAGSVHSAALMRFVLAPCACVHFSRGCDASWPQCASVLPVTGVPVNSRVSSKIQQLLNTLKRPKRPPLKEFFVDDFEELLEGEGCLPLSFCVCVSRVAVKSGNTQANVCRTWVIAVILSVTR